MAKVKRKRTNPSRVSATQADILKAKKAAADEAAEMAFALFLTVLGDKYGWSREQMAEYYSKVVYLADSVKQKRVTIPQLLYTLKEEYGIVLR